MQLQLQEPQQQHKVLLELIRSRQSVRQEERQIGQLAVEVIKLRKEAEVARLEALALDKEFQINQLLDKLDLGHLEDLGPPLLVKVPQEAPSQSRQPNQHQQHHNQSRQPNQHQRHHNQSRQPNQHQQHHNQPKRPSNLRRPQHNLWRHQEVPQGANRQQDRRQQGHQEDNHLRHHQEGRQAVNHKQLCRKSSQKVQILYLELHGQILFTIVTKPTLFSAHYV
jgi:hypothetical protein